MEVLNIHKMACYPLTVFLFRCKECVAFSINVCPWHDPMQFGTGYTLRYSRVQVEE